MVKVALCLQFGVRVDTEEVVWIVGTCFVDIFDSIWLFLLILSVTNAISNLLRKILVYQHEIKTSRSNLSILNIK